MTQHSNARDISLEGLLLLIAYAKEEAARLQLDDVALMLDLPELSVLQTYTGFDMDDIGRITTATEALSQLLDKNH